MYNKILQQLTNTYTILISLKAMDTYGSYSSSHWSAIERTIYPMLNIYMYMKESALLSYDGFFSLLKQNFIQFVLQTSTNLNWQPTAKKIYRNFIHWPNTSQLPGGHTKSLVHAILVFLLGVV